MKLSLCMIVKDEKENLEGCLSKIASFVDEIVIVDTGSKDCTKDIAKKYTNKIYDFNWCNDFSKARNYSIEKASNDWVLVLDADEYIEEFNKSAIEDSIKKDFNNTKVGRIKRINVIEDSNGDKKYIEYVNRLFNKKYFHYEGMIHEQIVSLQDKTYDTFKLRITANHIGYTKEVLSRTNKLKRNIDMLREAIRENPKDPYLYFQLGKSYFMKKDYIKSACNFEKALSFKLDFRLEYVSDLVESYGYSLINSNDFSKALTLEKFRELYANQPDFHFLLGLIYMNNAKFTEAVESFLKCTEFTEGKVEGITSFLPNYNIGVIFDILGYKEEAFGFYKKCGDYKPAVNNINAILNKK
ncbi:glycosyltransferase [Haloimpatiens sp. FM7315]|uniref:glycosyltransferase n=1 Tax=Haloimpatiens sp. FM7315 TaxID=3298609 RepID=UPI00370B0AEC